jgi:hypothetical protein
MYFSDTTPVAVTAPQEVPAALREYSSVIKYPVPGKDHTIDFTFYVDGDGKVEMLKFTDVTDPEHQVKVDEFEAEILTMVTGKKLSELTPFDKIGTSTLTTDALNEALVKIQATI